MLANADTDNQAPLTTTWHHLDVLWQADQARLQSGLPYYQLSPTWQMLILGDGSPTRHLQLLTGEPTEVDVIDMSFVGDQQDHAPDLIKAVSGPRLRRQVWLRTPSGQRLAYATSWWEASHVDEYLQNRSLPIWASLAQSRTELFRDIRQVLCGQSADLSAAFDHPGPFWGRYYLFWHNGKPLTLIYEVFSPHLHQYLGPVQSSTLPSSQP